MGTLAIAVFLVIFNISKTFGSPLPSSMIALFYDPITLTVIIVPIAY